jgi:DNA-binding transcriptional ArsR family regulator
MYAFDVLGDPVRRRILELLADGEQTAGALTAVIRAEFGISQPAVSQHLRVLRENGFLTVRLDGARRLYTVAPASLREVAVWLERFQGVWSQHLDALATEQEFARQSVHAWAAVVKDSGTATAEQLAAATEVSLGQFAPDQAPPPHQQTSD